MVSTTTEKKLKIAMVTDSFYPTLGGSETAIRMLSKIFISMGHDVRVFVVYPDVKNPDPEILTVKKISPEYHGFNLKVIGELKNLDKEISNFQPDIINAHFLLKSGYLGVTAAQKHNIASVASVRGKGIFYKETTLKSRIVSNWYRKRALEANSLIATSKEMADIVESRWGRKPSPISNGVDVDRFNPDIKTDLRQKLNLNDKKIILCVRRLVPKNGIEYMIRSLPEILKEHQDVYLILVAPKAKEYKKLQKLTEDLGVESKVIFMGPVEHSVLPDYYKISDLVVQPSIAEARSLSCLEAMSTGSSIIATNTGGLAELLNHKQTGFLIPAFEDSTYQVGSVTKEGVSNLSNAVNTLLSDDNLRLQIGKNARKEALKYSWVEICKKTLEVYRRAINLNKSHI